MQKETNAQCRVCKKEDEGILHLFLFCEKLSPFFKELKEIIRNLSDKEGDFNWNRFFFCWEWQIKQTRNLLICF